MRRGERDREQKGGGGTRLPLDKCRGGPRDPQALNGGAEGRKERGERRREGEGEGEAERKRRNTNRSATAILATPLDEGRVGLRDPQALEA